MSRAKASVLAVLTTLIAVMMMFSVPYTPAVVVQTETAEKGDWPRTVLFSGTIGYRKQPCVTVQSGVIAAVYAVPGQSVKKGELLFQMDTSAQEEALAAVEKARYQQKKALMASDEIVTAVAVQNELEWQEAEMQLQRVIEAAQIRAQTDGAVENVYVERGQYVPAAALLGMMRDEEKCILVQGRADRMEGLLSGMKAVMHCNESILGNAVISSILAPDESGMQQMMLVPEAAADLKNCADDEKITVDIVKETLRECTLIPVSAVDAEGNAWFVKNGRAYCEAAEILWLGDHKAVTTDEWEERQIVLNPEGLTEGCRVKEAKAK